MSHSLVVGGTGCPRLDHEEISAGVLEAVERDLPVFRVGEGDDG